MGRSSSNTRITLFSLVVKHTGSLSINVWLTYVCALIFLIIERGQRSAFLPAACHTTIVFVFHQFDTNEHDENCNIQI